MADPPEEVQNHLQDAVRKRKAREEAWRAQGERSPARNLALIGSIGWLVVCPILLGIAAGRWLDAHFHKGILFTAGLVMFGAAVGGFLAWQRVDRE